MSRSLALDDLYAIRFVSDPQLSPDGRTLAFVITRADRKDDLDRSTIWSVPASGGEPRELTTGGKDLSPRWSPDGRRLAFVSARGDGPAQVYLLPIDGGEARRLTELPLGAGEPVWSPDGARLAFSAPVDLDAKPEKPEGAAAHEPVVATRLLYQADGAGLLKGIRQHLFVVEIDANDAEPRQITSGDFFASTPVWSPDGSSIAFSVSLQEDRDLSPTSVVHVVPAAGGASRRVTPEDGDHVVFDWSPDGETLLLAGMERLELGLIRLFTVPAAGGQPVRLTPNLDRNAMTGNPGYPGAPPRYVDDGTAVFCVRERGRVHALSVSASGGEPTTVAGGDRVVAGVSTAGGRLAFVASSSSSPGELFVVEDGAERQLTELFAKDLPDVELVQPSQRTFRAPDGTEVEGWILRGGDTSGRTPLLLDIHGGPHNAFGPVFDGGHMWNQELVAKGWTVLTLNPRGSDGYGEAFWRALLDEGWGRADEGDFIAAIDALIEEGLVDRERVAVTGYSYGGYMTCWLTARTDRFAAAVAGGSVTNLLSEVGSADVGWFLGDIELGANAYESQDRLAELSPITHVRGVRTPTLLLHGEEDRRCPVGQAEEWFTALRSAQVPTELVRYPSGSHLFQFTGPPSQRLDYGRRLRDWVTRFAEEPGSGRTAPSLAHRLRGLQGKLDLLIERHHVPGASLAILDGDDLLEVASGVLNVETGVKATTDSLFQAGSVGKTFTATVIMQLVDEGLLDLDAPLVSVLPEFRVADEELTRTVTMRHILSHTSGIDGDHFPDTGRGDDCLAKFVETCAELQATHPLGATMSYCNTGYVVAGRVVEQLTGKVWEQALRERVLTPLGLSHTATLPEETIRFLTAYGHVGEAGEPPSLAPAYSLPRNLGPAGVSIICAPRDLVRFARMHLDDGRAEDGTQVLSPGAVKAMQVAQVDVPDESLGSQWGLGWILYDWHGRRLFGHDGNTIGQSAFLRVVPDRGLALAMIANGGNAHDLYEELYGELLGTLAGVELPEAPQPLPDAPAIDPSRYVGTFERSSVRLEVVERAGGLVLVTTVTGPLAAMVPKTTEEYAMHPAGPNRFVIRPEGAQGWSPLIFFDLADGTRCIHFGARATPMRRNA